MINNLTSSKKQTRWNIEEEHYQRWCCERTLKYQQLLYRNQQSIMIHLLLDVIRSWSEWYIGAEKNNNWFSFRRSEHKRIMFDSSYYRSKSTIQSLYSHMINNLTSDKIQTRWNIEEEYRQRWYCSKSTKVTSVIVLYRDKCSILVQFFLYVFSSCPSVNIKGEKATNWFSSRRSEHTPITLYSSCYRTKSAIQSLSSRLINNLTSDKNKNKMEYGRRVSSTVILFQKPSTISSYCIETKQ